MRRCLICCALLLASPAFGKPFIHKLAERRVWKVLTVASMGAAAADIHNTIHSLHLHDGAYEADPLARPLTNLPAPAYATLGMMGAAGVDWLGLKLQGSRHAWMRRCWWLPQVLQISGNIVGVTTSTHR